MSINPISLIAGSLSFTIGLAWNRAIGDTLVDIAGATLSPIARGCIITLIVIITVLIINIFLKIYNNITDSTIHEDIKDIGNDKNYKVKLFV